MFVELFAGAGAPLTSAMRRLGVQVAMPQDLASGGFDLRNPKAVEQLLAQLERWHRLGYDIVAHLATVCATFSAARDRSFRTRVRSPACPEGFRPMSEKVVDGNTLAYMTAKIVAFIVEQLNGSASIENPGRSYLWAYLGLLGTLAGLPQKEVMLNMCMFGAPWKKLTKLIFHGPFRAACLGALCHQRRPAFGCSRASCGRWYHLPQLALEQPEAGRR